jgi:hypothetical protein
VPLLSNATPAERLGEWPEIVFSALAAAALAAGVASAVAERRRSRAGQPALSAGSATAR